MKYWTILNGNPVGPMDLEQLIATPGFGPDTPVWHEGMDDWSTAGKLPQLAPLWQNQQQQPPKAEPYYGPDPYNRPNPFRQAPYGHDGGAHDGSYGRNGVYGENEREPFHTYAPGSQMPGGDGGPMPPTYLAWAILATLCCFLPTGIVAIIYASKVSPAWSRGDFAGARRASERAGLWIIISIVGGLIWSVFSGIWSLLTSLA